MKNLISTLILAGSLALTGCGNKKLETFTGVVVYEAHAHPDTFLHCHSENPFHTYVIYNGDSAIPVDFYKKLPLNLGDSVKVKYGQNTIFSKMTTSEKRAVKKMKRNVNEVESFKKLGKVDEGNFYDIQSKIKKDRSELQDYFDSIVEGEKK